MTELDYSPTFYLCKEKTIWPNPDKNTLEDR